jgi:hypothetical protein
VEYHKPEDSKKKARKAPTCGLCGAKGHYRKSCHYDRDIGVLGHGQPQSTSTYVDEEDDYEDLDCADVDTVITFMSAQMCLLA